MAALVPTSILALAGFVLTTYISLDTAFGWSKTFGDVSGDPAHLHNLACVPISSFLASRSLKDR